MPRRKRAKYAHLRFRPFAEEQREALKLFAQLPGLKEILEGLAREGHQHDGRGLIVWISTSGLAKDLEPPVFQSAASWRSNPLLINTPHPDLLQTLITYDPVRSYIILIVGGETADPAAARYTWWVQAFAQKRAVGFG